MKFSAFVVSLAAMVMLDKLSRVAVVGSSRGLGAALVDELHQRSPTARILGVSRKPSPGTAHWLRADVSKTEDQDAVLAEFADFKPEVVFSCVGGGPFGPYARREWKDHLWAFETTVLFSARLLHWALQGSELGPHQLILIGSSVAESNPDLGAASYAAAKHALRGLFESVVLEKPAVDVRLFSPGYMNTDLLPKGAPPRQGRIWQPRRVAEIILNWCESEKRYDHHCLAVFSEHK